MNTEMTIVILILSIVELGKIAGIAGICIGFLLIIFRKALEHQNIDIGTIRLIIILSFITGLTGLLGWFYSGGISNGKVKYEKITNEEIVQIVKEYEFLVKEKRYDLIKESFDTKIIQFHESVDPSFSKIESNLKLYNRTHKDVKWKIYYDDDDFDISTTSDKDYEVIYKAKSEAYNTELKTREDFCIIEKMIINSEGKIIYIKEVERIDFENCP